MRCCNHRAKIKCADWHFAVFLTLLTAITSAYHLLILPELTGVPSRFNPSVGEFSPNLVTAVMIATGRGFVEPFDGDGAQALYPDAPVLSQFLRREIQHIAPEDIPSTLQTCAPRVNWEYRHRYLLYTVGMLWRIFGISWHIVTVFRIFLYCLTMVLIFFLLRLGMGPFISAFCVVLLILHQDILMYIYNVRDFSKGPFILLAMLIIGRLVKYPVKRVTLGGTALLLGIIIGIGIGFRADVLVCLFPASLAVLFCRTTTERMSIRTRLAALCLLAASFIIPASWIMGVYGGGSLFAHDILMGFATKCDDLLGINRASYEKLYVNNDFFIASTAEEYNERVYTMSMDSSFIIDERPFLFNIIRTFPGDVITKGYASVLWIARGDSSSPVFGIFMTGCLLTMLLIIARHDLRLAWLLLILFFYFGGYLSLQPERRHAFHLLFVPYWILGFLFDKFLFVLRKESIINRVKRIPFMPLPSKQWWNSLRRPLFFFALPALLVISVPLYASRLYQNSVVGDMLPLYTTAKLIPIDSFSSSMKDWVLFTPTGNIPPCSKPIGMSKLCLEYWVAEFSPSTQWRPIWLHYENDEDAFNLFAHGLWVAPSGTGDSGNIKYFFPVVERANFSPGANRLFSGIAIPKDHASDFKGLYKVLNSEAFPSFLNLSLPSDCDAFRRYQTLYGKTSLVLNAEEARFWFGPEPNTSAPSVAPF